jgi:hypothetical protein
MAIDRPDGSSIASLRGQLRSVWDGAHALMRRADDLYWREYDVWPTPALNQRRPSYRPSTPANIVDHASDAQVAYEPRFHRDLPGDGTQQQSDADFIEKWMSDVFSEAARHEMFNPFKQAGRHMLQYGYTAMIGPVLDYSDQPKEPKQRSGESEEEFAERRSVFRIAENNWFPIRMKAVHPGSVLMHPQEKTPNLAIVKDKKFVVDLERLTTSKKRLKGTLQWRRDIGMKDYDVVAVEEFWTPEWHSLLLGDSSDVLYTERNLLGYVPLVHGFSGFGMGRMSDYGSDPSYLAVGLLRHVDQSIVAEAQAKTASLNMHQSAGWPMRGAPDEQSASEYARRVATDEMLVGQREQFWVENVGQMSQWMFEAQRDVERDIIAGTYRDAISGGREPGVTTVGQQAILTNAAERKFIGTQEQLEHMASVVASRCLMLADRMGGMAVRRRRLRPSQIHRDYGIRARFELIDPIIQLQRREMALREFGAGLMSDETYWETAARLEDVTEERRRLFRTALFRDPEVVQMGKEAIARGEGLGEIEQRLEERIAGNGAVEQGTLRQPLSNRTASPGQPNVGVAIPPTPPGP